MLRGLLVAALVAVTAAAAPSGTYSGSKTVLGEDIDAKVIINSETDMEFVISGVIDIDCEEDYTYDGDATISLDNVETDGDCAHDALDENKVTLKGIAYDSSADEITVSVKYSVLSEDITLTKSGLYDSSDDNNAGCAACKKVVKVVEREIKHGNATVEAIEAAVGALCKVIGGPKVKQECQDMLDNIDEIIQYVEEGLDPKEACEKLGLCGSRSGVAAVAVETDQCTTCHLLVEAIDEQISENNGTVQTIVVVVEALCDAIGGPVVSRECDAIVDNIDSIIEWIEEGLKPDEICEKLGLCDSFVAMEMEAVPIETDQCTTCTILVDAIDAEMQKTNSTIQAVVAVVEALCDAIGGPVVSRECDAIVDHIDSIIEWIEQGLDPKDICENLGLCDESRKLEVDEPMFLLQEPEEEGLSLDRDGCETCSMVVTIIDAEISFANATIEKVEQIADTVCHLIPLVPKRECDKIIDHVDEIAQMLMERMSPDEICERLDLCDEE